MRGFISFRKLEGRDLVVNKVFLGDQSLSRAEETRLIVEKASKYLEEFKLKFPEFVNADFTGYWFEIPDSDIVRAPCTGHHESSTGEVDLAGALHRVLERGGPT